MIREFVPFHEDTIRKELDELPPKDAAKLASLMGHYEQFRGDCYFLQRIVRQALSGW
jgi:hypothetical protein